MIDLIIKLVLEPKAFFEQHTLEENRCPTLLDDTGKPFLIVLTAAVLTLTSLVILGDRLVKLVPRDGVFLFAIVHGFSAFGTFLGVIVSWPLLALATHALITVLTNNTYSPRHVLSLLGWSYTPMVIYSLSLILVAWLWPIPTGTLNSMDELSMALDASRIFKVAQQLWLVSTIWSGGIALSGLVVYYRTSWLRAAVALSTPVAVLVAAQELLVIFRR